jgi:hypothetical protein
MFRSLIRSSKLEARSSKLEARSSKLEARSSKLEARSSKWASLSPVVIGVILCCGREAAAQSNPPQNRFSTHDWTLPTFGGGGGGEPIIGTNDFREFWADVKTAGDGSAYSVGTIEVRTTLPGATFSGSPASPPLALPPFTVTGTTTPARQVVMLQQADTAGPVIARQRYYYGTNGDDSLRATHGRGVSVWPALNPSDTRIAICGESQDETLPLSNVAGWPGAGGAGTAGFIAVFDGGGNLLWSHHFFGVAEEQHCAITDVSVRFDATTGLDVVTFCGVSSYGNPAANATLTSVAPYALPAGSCAGSATGLTDNGAGQWDGIVGRLTSSHATPVPATVAFLSCVGGSQQDGLFGIAEIDADRFVVVGSTGNGGVVPPGADFPVTFGNCVSTGTAPFSAGVAMKFGPISGGTLTLESSQLLGSLAAGTDTVARDVSVHRQWGQAGEPGLVLVGATNDGQLLGAGSLTFPPSVLPQATIGGGVDGFVLAGYDLGVTAPVVWNVATFRGGEGDESLTGVQGWNEFYDSFVVTGPSAAADIDIASYYKLPVAVGLALLTGGATAGLPLGGAQIGGTSLDRPTAVAVPVNGPPMMNATTLGGFSEFALGNPAGGGISVNAEGRVNVVGTTVSTNFPVTAVGGPPGRAKTGVTHDAVRTAMDMVPPGIGRTDGTGMPVPAGGPPGGYPLLGVFGGTTPECALTPFGHQIGTTDPQMAPATPRMMIDWEGLAPANGVSGFVVVTRPANSAGFLAAMLQFNFPGTNPLMPVGGGPLPVLPDGVLLWTTDPSAVVFSATTPGFDSLRFPLSPLPPSAPAGSFTVTAQLICLLATPITGGAIGPVCPGGGQSNFAASPAMWINW